jgi:hypothetical protein
MTQQKYLGRHLIVTLFAGFVLGIVASSPLVKTLLPKDKPKQFGSYQDLMNASTSNLGRSTGRLKELLR